MDYRQTTRILSATKIKNYLKHLALANDVEIQFDSKARGDCYYYATVHFAIVDSSQNVNHFHIFTSDQRDGANNTRIIVRGCKHFKDHTGFVNVDCGHVAHDEWHPKLARFIFTQVNQHQLCQEAIK